MFIGKIINNQGINVKLRSVPKNTNEEQGEIDEKKLIQKINDNASKNASDDLCETLIITGNNIQYIGEKALYRNSTGYRCIVFQDLSFDNFEKQLRFQLHYS